MPHCLTYRSSALLPTLPASLCPLPLRPRTLAEDASSEGRKLQERLAAAQEEYTRGLAKMKATRCAAAAP